jgi:hypothetical protein
MHVESRVYGRRYKQGDQIGRILAQWATITFVIFVKNTETAISIRLLFSTAKSYVLIFTKMDWATFWATFSQTHLVTLVINIVV